MRKENLSPEGSGHISSKEEVHKKRERFASEILQPLQKSVGSMRTKAAELLERQAIESAVARIVAVTKHDEAETAREGARLDDLTGILRRNAFVQQAEKYLATEMSVNAAVLFFDLDDFKARNDGFGHDVGDETIVEFVRSLKARFESRKQACIIGRWGGEEFVVLIPGVKAKEVQKFFPNFGFSFMSKIKQGKKFKTTVSVGVVVLPYKADLKKAIPLADHAMYVQKSRGKNGVLVFSPEIETSYQELEAAQTK